ncbi:hypothetical protein VE02_09906 [Pseudogymnoascus sp. 03VT05]|nr:hypothetical protein VE02_09906 [Pseudogymnoascus sp. 03VT05]
MDTTIPNPGGISDSDIAALETWVHENSTIDIDAPDHSQSPQDRQLDRPLASLIYKESQTLKDFSKIADDAHAKVEVASAMKGCKTKGSI